MASLYEMTHNGPAFAIAELKRLEALAEATAEQRLVAKAAEAKRQRADAAWLKRRAKQLKMELALSEWHRQGAAVIKAMGSRPAPKKVPASRFNPRRVPLGHFPHAPATGPSATDLWHDGERGRGYAVPHNMVPADVEPWDLWVNSEESALGKYALAVDNVY